jgi:hypothetical protein
VHAEFAQLAQRLALHLVVTALGVDPALAMRARELTRLAAVRAVRAALGFLVGHLAISFSAR